MLTMVAEYGVTNWFGLSLGMLYSEQGANHFGLTKIDKTENPDTAHNRYLSLTLGYRFHL